MDAGSSNSTAPGPLLSANCMSIANKLTEKNAFCVIF